jgi:hypothetical protein
MLQDLDHTAVSCSTAATKWLARPSCGKFDAARKRLAKYRYDLSFAVFQLSVMRGKQVEIKTEEGLFVDRKDNPRSNA